MSKRMPRLLPIGPFIALPTLILVHSNNLVAKYALNVVTISDDFMYLQRFILFLSCLIATVSLQYALP